MLLLHSWLFICNYCWFFIQITINVSQYRLLFKRLFTVNQFQCSTDYFLTLKLSVWLKRVLFCVGDVNTDLINTGMGMKFSSRHSFAPIDSISGGPTPYVSTPWSEVRRGSLPPIREEAISPSSLPRYVYSGPGGRATPLSLSTVCILLGRRLCFSSHFRNSWV